jgi:uncharacterized hydrophobic protein (TIGR00271 family)
MEENKNVENDPTKIDIDADTIVNLPKSVFNFFKDTISLQNEVDKKATMEGIKQNIEVKGSAVWILICSILVASVGLNFNSVAVIIGAMLISPLMGPIRGVGLALATNDFKTLVKGLKNFGVMIAFSLFTAILYFWFTPIKGDTSELLGRVKPQAFDVIIAFFGGLAGIIASASNNKSAAMTIVPGVAIATALMPPLCTMSYGIASGHWDYALGAFYLFLLNSVFICLSTVVLLRVLKFPKLAFVNPKTERKVKIYSFIALLLIVIPSIYKTVVIVQESIFEKNAENFINDVILSDDNYLYTTEVEYNEGAPIFKVYTGGEEISQEKLDLWKSLLPEGLENATIVPKGKKKDVDMTHLENFAEVKAKLAIAQEGTHKLNTEIEQLKTTLNKFENNSVDIKELGLRVKNAFPAVKEITYGKSFSYNVNGNIDTVYVFNIDWKDSIDVNYLKMESTKLTSMLTTELEIADSTSKDKVIKVFW